MEREREADEPVQSTGEDASEANFVQRYVPCKLNSASRREIGSKEGR